MTSANAGRAESRNSTSTATLASLAVGVVFFAFWFWALPSWLGFRVEAMGGAKWRWIAVIPSVLGFAVALRSVWDFGRTGRGTQPPMAPPKRLVVVGFYWRVRNPMYLGFLTGWAGLWVVFGRASVASIAVSLVVLLVVALFVKLYEEPTLRRKFGGSYQEHCRNVPRWLPRLRPWIG